MSIFFVVQLAQGEVSRQWEINAFQRAGQSTLPTSKSSPQPVLTTAFDGSSKQDSFPMIAEAPDTSLWASGRVADYQASLRQDLPPILGILEIPDVGLKVPVYPSDSELAMNRGAGVIDGMAYPHEPGNIGIAGHRDGYFRALKEVFPGQRIVLQTLQGPKYFTVDNTRVVDISDTSVLQDTRDQTMTLVTCYPFYFVGHAPQRFIVTASLDSTYVSQY